MNDNTPFWMMAMLAVALLATTIGFYAGKARVHVDIKTFNATKIDTVLYRCEKEVSK